MTELGSATLEGARARAVQVECSLIKGLPSFTIVGLGDSSIQESKERVSTTKDDWTSSKIIRQILTHLLKTPHKRI